MSDEKPKSAARPRRPALINDWVSLTGLFVAASSFFAVICLLAFDFFAHFKNPYMGILTYMVAPMFLIMGLILIALGAWRVRRRRRKMTPDEVPPFPRFDLNDPHQRHVFVMFAVVAFVFMLVTAMGTYRAYHFTESDQFCGATCHSVMHPEYTAYQNSPHARVACTQCHIGPGATWFVRSKLSGTYQVFATLADKYPRPIPTPIKNLRPAQETCEQCHWPQKFFGSAERMNQHFMADEENTPWTIRLLMKIGGGDPTHGPVGGIHWHMNINNKVEYIAADDERQVIPWVRFTEPGGKVTIFQSTENPLSTEQVATAKPRRMDCVDCHNRPSHIYHPPARAVNIAMSTGRIDPSIPFIKRQAVEVLIREYQSTEVALREIRATLIGFYETKKYAEFMAKNRPLVERAVKEVQDIYRNNFFPAMKVNWRTYPNHIGHTIFSGCYRCHDGKHVAADGRIISHDCNACHIIIAQGRGGQLAKISPEGLEFEHPVDIGDLWKEMNCHECHPGALAR